MQMRTVYVIAWENGPVEGGGSGGFDWYPTQEDRDKAWPQELENMKDKRLNNWRAVKFEALVDPQRDQEAITKVLDQFIWEHTLQELGGRVHKVEVTV